MTKSKTHGGMKLKKFLSVLCLSCLLFSCASVTAMAAGKGMIESSSCEAEKGETVEVYLTLKENPGIWGTKIKVKYDDSALTLKSVKAGSVFSESELTYSEKMNKNPYVIVATGNTAKNKTATGKLVTLEFAVSKDAKYKEYPIEVDVVQSINKSGKDVSMSSADGSINVEKEQVTPSEPTDPSKPTDPTEPSKPTEPGDNDDPTKPGDNDDPSKPSDDNDEPSKPGDNDDPTDSGDGNDDLTGSGDGEGDKPNDGDGDKPSDDEGNNTPEDESDENTNEDSTGTGDNNVLLPFAGIMVAALAVFVAAIKRRRS